MLRLLLLAAVLPAVFLMGYVYRMDTVEKEPWYLLRRLVLCGAAACLPASLLEQAFLGVLSRYVEPDTLRYAAWEAFGIVALAEEGCKLAALRAVTWRSPEFNYRFDGIVYAVFLGLGFAALENILYLFNYGPGVLTSRGLLAIPGHATFAVFMGLFYAQAKMADIYGAAGARRVHMAAALAVPALLHGFYDFCLMSGVRQLGSLFIVFVLVLDAVSLLVVRRQSFRDGPLE